MKKVLLLSAISVYLFACTDSGTSTKSGTDDDTLTTAELSKYPKYQEAYVQAMVDYYFTLPKTNSNIIGTISFNSPQTRKLLKNHERMMIIVGAYLTDTLGQKKGSRAVVIQLKKDKDTYSYFDYTSLLPGTMAVEAGICPPPYDIPCRIQAIK